MRRAIIIGAAAVAAALALTATAEASSATVPCWGPANGGYGWGFTWAAKPRQCAWHGSSGVHADYLPVENMRWRTWGRSTACGRGTFRANSGFRAPTRFCLYAKVRDNVEGDYYTRIRGVVGKGCAWGVGVGKRCGLGKPFRFRVTVS